jgi:hypothetical protein
VLISTSSHQRKNGQGVPIVEYYVLFNVPGIQQYGSKFGFWQFELFNNLTDGRLLWIITPFFLEPTIPKCGKKFNRYRHVPSLSGFCGTIALRFLQP